MLGASLSLKGRALRLLASREYTRAELVSKLSSHAESAEALEAVLDLLQAKGLLSDERAAEALVHRRSAKLGSQRVLHELRQRGVGDDLVAAAREQLAGTELARAQAVWAKKFSAAPSNAAERAKQMRFLASRGFSGAVVAQLLRAVGDAHDPDADASEPD